MMILVRVWLSFVLSSRCVRLGWLVMNEFPLRCAVTRLVCLSLLQVCPIATMSMLSFVVNLWTDGRVRLGV